MSLFAKNKALVTKVAQRLAARDDEPVWQNIHQDRQREYLGQAIGLLDLVDESAVSADVATALCAHCIDIIPNTNPRCPCHDWPLCSKCQRKATETQSSSKTVPRKKRVKKKVRKLKKTKPGQVKKAS